MTTADINTACSHISRDLTGRCFACGHVDEAMRADQAAADAWHAARAAANAPDDPRDDPWDPFAYNPCAHGGSCQVCNHDDWCGACRSPGHTVDECTDNPNKPPPAGRTAPRIIAERRPVYTVKIGKRNRRFSTKGAAYYALAKRLLVVKYMGPLATAGHSTKLKITTEELAAQTGLDADAIRARGERAVEMFITDERFDGGAFVDSDGYFDTGKWQAYVRRVAKKLRALDEYADKKRKEQP